MSVEIEIKAWADDWESVKNHIDAFAQCTGSYEKSDAYWIVPPDKEFFISGLISGVRIRKESFIKADDQQEMVTRVCFKKKELRADMEVNIEKEFDITNAAVFEELLSGFGLIRGTSKHKRGWSWNYEHITIELSEVEDLGWFCELEIISEQEDPDFIVLSGKRLYEVLKKTGIDSSKIEPRYYTEMLKENQKS